MDRELRRELSKRKWISRAKKVYNACGKFYVPVAGIKANVRYNVPIIRNKALKVCESITDFLDSSKYAKMLKNCTSPYRSRMMNTRKRIERIDIKQKEIFKKVFKNMNLGTIFRVHPAFSMIKAFAKRDY